MTDRYSIRQLAAEFGTDYYRTLARLRRGWSLDRALTAPPRHQGLGPATHGRTQTKEYRAWQSMRYRCSSSAYQSWHRYGGRGLSVCERWRKSFEAFFEDMGPAPSPRHSLGRMNNDLGYQPSNVEWQTAKQQAQTRARPRRT